MKAKNCWHHLLYAVICTLVYLQQGNVKKSKNLMKVVNINEENCHIFRTTWRNSVKFSRKMCLIMIILKHKKPGLYPFSKKHSFEKTTGGGQIDCPSAFLGLNKKKNQLKLMYLLNTIIQSSFYFRLLFHF